MSTTVTYKGETLTTVSNATKTLLTEGKYLEDDLTLTDVSGGGATLVTKNISANGTYNASSDSADGYSQVNVAVPASAVDSGTKSITANGNGQDVIGYAAVNVAVPNSYSASDEGKVVSNGALVAQTSDTVTTNDTYDTTLIDSLTVNVSGSPSGYESGTFVAASNTQSFSVPVSNTYTHFAIVLVGKITDNTLSAQTLIMGSGEAHYQFVTDTYNGTTFTSGAKDNDWRSVLTFSSSTISGSFLGNGAKVTFPAGNTYRWVAW